MNLLSVTSEIFPLIKTGGLADVTGALPAALAAENITVHTLIPGYPAVIAALENPRLVHTLPGAGGRILAGQAQDLNLLVLDAPHFYARPGNPYLGPDGRDWPDNAQRFAALAQAAAAIGRGAIPGYQPDVIHAHDWQAGLTPAYLHHRGGPRPATVMTIHNLAFPGLAPARLLSLLDLPPAAYAADGVEFHGAISFLKAGLWYADRITTVSPTYAAEILTPEAGMGFDGLLRHRAGDLSGILNGIDTTVWNPAADKLIAAPFTRARLAKRAANKAALQTRMGLTPDPAAPLFGVVSRLTGQKGMDVLLACLPVLHALGVQLAVLGAGDPGLEAAFQAEAAAAPDTVACVIGYDETLAHRMQAGVDALLVPSRFEPCGLTQLCALRYGAVPVVARTGGLADTVIDANPAALAAGAATGVQFSPVTAGALAHALRRTVALYHEPAAWRALQRNGMAADVSWRVPARHYADLYRALLAARA